MRKVRIKNRSEASSFFPYKGKFIQNLKKTGKASEKFKNALEDALNIVRTSFQADGCLLFLFDPSTGFLELARTAGIDWSEVRVPKIDPGKSLPGSVFASQKPLLSNDVRNDDRFDKTFKRELIFNTYKLIAVPLVRGRTCVGVLEVVNKPSGRDFSPKQMRLLKTVSRDFVWMVENEQHFETCAHKLHQRSSMLDLAREVNTVRELQDLLNFIVVKAAELLNSEASSLLLREGDSLRFEIAFGEKGTEVKKLSVPLGAGIAGRVALSGKSTFVNRADVDGSGIFKEIDKKSGFTTRNLLCSPLRVEERIIGVVEVVNRRDREVFDEDDISLLEGFANEAAIAIERAQLIEERIQAERLATVGRTVAGLAHCIKNITNALKAGEYIVDKGFRDNSTETVKKGWEFTKQGLQRVSDLVLDMLTISKRRELELSTCCPHELATEVVRMIDEKAGEKKVKITIQFDRSVGQVMIDRNKIFRCLLNLASNSLDACRERGGKITIQTFGIKGKPFFGYQVIDNGHGISEENQKKLFHEFFSTKGSQGTGLGLSVTKAIISEHGGSIRCDSQPGQGTTFTIELPTRQ